MIHRDNHAVPEGSGGSVKPYPGCRYRSDNGSPGQGFGGVQVTPGSWWTGTRPSLVCGGVVRSPVEIFVGVFATVHGADRATVDGEADLRQQGMDYLAFLPAVVSIKAPALLVATSPFEMSPWMRGFEISYRPGRSSRRHASAR